MENLSAPDEFSRRGVLKVLAGASTALALGVPGCERKPRRQIVSRVAGPEYQRPGKVLYYSSTWTEGPHPYGLMIRAVDGRPVKIEGNPDHPINEGASSAMMQASLLSLYDPDRLRAPCKRRQDATWASADQEIVEALRQAASVVLMTRATLGPSQRQVIKEFLTVCRGARHLVYESVHDAPRRRAWASLYGSAGELLPRFDRARVIVSLDSDFLGADGAILESIRRFVTGRQLEDRTHRTAEMSRLHVIESAMTLTGSNADHRLRLVPSAMGPLATALRHALRGDDRILTELASAYRLGLDTLLALVEDLRDHRGQAVVVAGPHLPASAHAAVALLNDDLQAPDRTLEWNPRPGHLPITPPQEAEALLARGVDVLICLSVNPVYDWPGGGFQAILDKVGLSAGHGLYPDETVSACTFSLPTSHNLESWDDACSGPGVDALCQPVIAPLFDTRQEAESLLKWTQASSPQGDPIRHFEDWHAYLKAGWERRMAEAGTDAVAGRTSWEDALRVGGRFVQKALPLPPLNRDVAETIARESRQGGQYELLIRPHHAIHDGRFANNGWLQELPDPVSKHVWDNPACISPKTALGLGVEEGDLLTVTVGEASVTLPAVIQRGMADGVVVATLGHGRTAGGSVAQEAGGTNLAPLLGREDPDTPHLAVNVRVSLARGARRPVRTQKEFSMHGRPIALDGTLDEYRREADFVKRRRHLPGPADLYPPYNDSKGHKWAMAIDLGACVGCGACMIACQAENNIPIVGRAQCAAGREMHWIRIDRYEDGDPDNPTVTHQPMLCQHCDHAPCENVCPVNATAHSPEGLNEMVYNRCVGTRYCSNNCPYKVRRFNFLRFQEARLRDPVQELAFNPQVTVRGVGVMEKCTFCVQRITEVKSPRPTPARGRRTPVFERPASRLARPGRSSSAISTIPPAGSPNDVRPRGRSSSWKS